MTRLHEREANLRQQELLVETEKRKLQQASIISPQNEKIVASPNPPPPLKRGSSYPSPNFIVEEMKSAASGLSSAAGIQTPNFPSTASRTPALPSPDQAPVDWKEYYAQKYSLGSRTGSMFYSSATPR